MANRQVTTGVRREPRSSPSPRIKKQTASRRKVESREVRRSARLEAIARAEVGGTRKELEAGLSLTGEILRDPVQSRSPNTPPEPRLKRKRDQEAPNSSLPVPNPPPAKRPRKSAQSAAEGQSEEGEQEFITGWVQNKQWPREYFEPDDQGREGILERDSWLDDIMAQPPIPVVQYVERNGFRYPLPVKKAPTSLRRKQSDSSLNESSDQKKRESKSTPYRDARYTAMLEAKGSFLRDFDHEFSQARTDICDQLLTKDQIMPENSLFRDDLFGRLCWKIQDRNEAMIIQDVTRLIVPSAMNLAIYGDSHLDILIESTNEAWAGSIAFEGPRPQPDYAVGFGRSAFTNEQLKKLGPLIGSVFDTSLFVATYRMYFPFLTCEVKCGAAALDIADRQNAHSMTIAVRSVVELYKSVKREKELDREFLAFSISHDHRSVRIYGHYPVIDGDRVTFYSHPIREFSFVELNGREKWTTYKFTKNVYDVWMPDHLTRICSAVDQLPSSLDFQVSEGPEVQSEAATGLSQDMGSLLSEPNAVDLASQEDDELHPPVPQTATPDTSVSKVVGQGTAKRAKKARVTK